MLYLKKKYYNLISETKLKLRMESGILRVSRWMILAFSFLMFLYQSQVAIHKLVDPPVVDSTEILNVIDMEPPLMMLQIILMIYLQSKQ